MNNKLIKQRVIALKISTPTAITYTKCCGALFIMGQYRFSVYGHWQIGLMVKLDSHTLYISLPFITMHIAITKHAKGIEIFNKYLG